VIVDIVHKNGPRSVFIVPAGPAICNETSEEVGVIISFSEKCCVVVDILVFIPSFGTREDDYGHILMVIKSRGMTWAGHMV
jgi:hypothetical protein